MGIVSVLLARGTYPLGNPRHPLSKQGVGTMKLSGITARACAPQGVRARESSRRATCVRAAPDGDSWLQQAGRKAAALSLAGLMTLAPVAPALASEFDILAEAAPQGTYIVDDAGVLNTVTRNEVNKQLYNLEKETGFKLNVVTIRKLEFDPDVFSFSDKVLEKWYPTKEVGDKKGVLLVVTTSKEGAISGGPAFLNTAGDDVLDAVINNNIPIFTEEEKYNESVTSSVKRIASVLEGKPDPGGPERKTTKRKRTFRTKEETEKSKSVTSTVVLTLLFISVVVPMLQYYGYTARD
ncbi:unnamed protein product [Pedinophyceae sp. YPF-701]|nr:unnamed protein product [Pedinophyceae sp. YPF-701]